NGTNEALPAFGLQRFSTISVQKTVDNSSRTRNKALAAREKKQIAQHSSSAAAATWKLLKHKRNRRDSLTEVIGQIASVKIHAGSEASDRRLFHGCHSCDHPRRSHFGIH